MIAPFTEMLLPNLIKLNFNFGSMLLNIKIMKIVRFSYSLFCTLLHDTVALSHIHIGGIHIRPDIFEVGLLFASVSSIVFFLQSDVL